MSTKRKAGKCPDETPQAKRHKTTTKTAEESNEAKTEEACPKMPITVMKITAPEFNDDDDVPPQEGEQRFCRKCWSALGDTFVQCDWCGTRHCSYTCSEKSNACCTKRADKTHRPVDPDDHSCPCCGRFVAVDLQAYKTGSRCATCRLGVCSPRCAERCCSAYEEVKYPKEDDRIPFHADMYLVAGSACKVEADSVGANGRRIVDKFEFKAPSDDYEALVLDMRTREDARLGLYFSRRDLQSSRPGNLRLLRLTFKPRVK